MITDMTQQQKVLAWTGAVVGALMAAGLLGLVVARDLDTADQVASVLGAIAGLAGLGVSVHALKQPPSQSAAGSVVTASGDGSVAVGGSIAGDVSTGNHHSAVQEPGRRRTRSVPQPPPGAGTVQATGKRSVATGGNISGRVSTGDGNSGTGAR